MTSPQGGTVAELGERLDQPATQKAPTTPVLSNTVTGMHVCSKQTHTDQS